MQFRLEKIQRDFLWGVGNLTRKIHLVKWSTVCTSKEKGGLGIRSLPTLNMALLGKWIWRFSFEVNSTWREFINLKYGTKMVIGSLRFLKATTEWAYGRRSTKKLSG